MTPSWLRNSLGRLQQRNRALRDEPDPEPPPRMEADGVVPQDEMERRYPRITFDPGDFAHNGISGYVIMYHGGRPKRNPVGTPKSRAERLLRRTLPKKEWLRYMMKGYVLVRGSAGGLYRLRQAKANGVDQWRPKKRTICAVPERVSELNPADMIVAQYLALKNDEPEFLRIALREGGAYGMDMAARNRDVLGLGMGVNQAAAAMSAREAELRMRYQAEAMRNIAQAQMRMYEERFRPPPGFVEWDGSVRGRIYQVLNLREPNEYVDRLAEAALRHEDFHGPIVGLSWSDDDLESLRVVTCRYDDGYRLNMGVRDSWVGYHRLP